MDDKPTPLKYGELFAGVGGFGMGMEQAGYEPVFQVEWDKNCLKVLHHHWPTVPKWGDVCEVNGADLPPCDVLIFGSPCQDLSVAGKRAGLQDGEKSSMFFEAVRIIKEMRDATNSIYPRATIWENVPGALSSNRGADFATVLSSLADIGAHLQEYAVLDAQHFGVPQRRRRIFLVSIFSVLNPAASERCSDPLLPVIKGSRGDFAKGRKARKDAARNVEASLDSSGQWWDGQTIATDPVNMPISEIGPTLTTTYGAKNYSNHQEVISGSVVPVAYSILQTADIVGALCARDFKGVGNQYVAENKLVVQEAFVKSRRAQSNTDDETWIEGEVTPTLNAFDNGGESRATVLMPIVYDGYNQKLDDTGIHRSLRIGRDSSDFVAQPIYSFDTQFGSNAAVFEDQSPSITMPGLAVRRLTPLECERLMGWPDDHTRWTADGKEQADTNRYRQCGNGVATPVAAWVGEQLRLVLEM